MRVRRLAVVLVALSLGGCVSSTPTGPSLTFVVSTPPPPTVAITAPAPAPSEGAIETAGPVPTDFPIAGSSPLAAWTSLVPGVPVFPTLNGVAMSSIGNVIAFHGELIAVGTAEPADGVVFTSEDRVTWTPEPDAGGIFANAAPRAIVSDGDHLLIVGVPADLGQTFNPGDVVLWSSSDGRTWERQPDGLLGADLGPTTGSFTRGFQAGGGGFLAWSDVDVAQPRFILSRNAVDWQASTLDNPFDGGRVTSVVPFRGGWVAAGYRDGVAADGSNVRATASWWSPDGLHWRAATVKTGSGGIVRAYAGQSGIVGYGPYCAGIGCTVSTPVAWQSDGKVWTGSQVSDPNAFPQFETDGSRLIRADLAWSADGKTWTPLPVRPAYVSPPGIDLATINVVDDGLVYGVRKNVGTEAAPVYQYGFVWFAARL